LWIIARRRRTLGIESKEQWPKNVRCEAADQIENRRAPKNDSADAAGSLTGCGIIRIASSALQLQLGSNRIDGDEIAGDQESAFFGWRAFFAVLAFLAVVRLPLGCGAPVSGVFSVSIVFVLMLFLLDRVAVVTSITRLGENCKQNRWRTAKEPLNAPIDYGYWRRGVLFY
jgi:hypothetical protein